MSSWDTDSGGFFDEGEVTITKARFSYDQDYQGGDVLVLIMEGETKDGEDFRQLYSIGNGWEPESKGKKAVGLDKFRDNTNYAMFFEAALKTEAKDVIIERGYPDEATIWEGLTFEMVNQKVERKGLSPSNLAMPTKFVGVDSGKADASEGKPKAEKAKKGNSKGANSKLEAKIRKLAKASDDHDDFLIEVLETYPEVEDNEELYQRVLVEDGIWSEARG